jgi:hypothetical protein
MNEWAFSPFETCRPNSIVAKNYMKTQPNEQPNYMVYDE